MAVERFKGRKRLTGELGRRATRDGGMRTAPPSNNNFKKTTNRCENDE